MAITTYSELQTAIGNWLDEDNLSDRIPEFIALAEDRIYRDPRIRIREMEATTDLTVNAQEVSLPTGFLGARRLYISGSPNRKLDFLPPEDFWLRYMSTTTGKPVAYTVEGENLVFGPRRIRHTRASSCTGSG